MKKYRIYTGQHGFAQDVILEFQASTDENAILAFRAYADRPDMVGKTLRLARVQIEEVVIPLTCVIR